MVKAVKWSKSAQKQLKNLYNFILEDSFQNAVKVKTIFCGQQKYYQVILINFQLINIE
jgi:hypothetical protein